MSMNVILSLISASGMIFAACAAVIYWRRVTRLQYRWFWAGAGLWFIAVALKIGSSLLLTAPVLKYLKANCGHDWLVVLGGLFIGLQSSIFEIGLTLLAVVIWQRLGKDAETAIGAGAGAGAIEAVLLGVAVYVSMVSVLLNLPGSNKIMTGIDTIAATTPLFFLVGPVERVIAILCHTSSRAMVLLGVTKKRPMLVIWGFVLFTLLDGIVGAYHLSGEMGQISMWVVELTILPLAVISIPVIIKCYMKWGGIPAGGETLSGFYGTNSRLIEQ